MMTRLPRKDFGTTPDFELVRHARAGCVWAFELIMRRYNRRLFRVALSVVRIPADAEDVVQEAYVRAFTRLDQFTGPDGFASWLTTIALNEARQHVRRTGRWAALLDFARERGASGGPPTMENFPDDAPGPERLAAADELRRVLERAIADLPERFRTVFVMRAVEQMSVEETALCLDLRSATVKTRLHRAKALLRRSLQDHAEDLLSELYPFAGKRCDGVVAAVLVRLGLPFTEERRRR